MGRKKHSVDYLPVCALCEHSRDVNDDYNVLCKFKGIVACEYVCKKFAYDPLKRVPLAMPPLMKFNDKDFDIQ